MQHYIDFARGVQSPRIAADNRHVKRLQSSIFSCRVPLHGPVKFAIIRGIRLVGHMFSQKLYVPLLRSSPHVTHCSSDQAHSSSQTATRSVQLFLYRSQMLCCTMHCQWGRIPPILPLPLGFRHPAERKPIHGHRQHAQNIW